MATLSVQNFSCVAEAELDLSRLTILIGPQASGKSVLSKLVYFFNDIPRRRYRELEDERPFDFFKRKLIDDFKKWFPPSAWGQHNFTITFRAGPYFVKVTRVRSKRDPDGDVRFNFSPEFETEYKKFLQDWQRSFASKEAAEEDRELPIHEPDVFYRMQTAAERRRESLWREHFVRWQLFVPAGRSFFTSIGKAIAAFEYGGLDPLTLTFGRFFASIRERRRNRILSRRVDRSMQAARDSMMQELFGGSIKFAREQEFVEADDGRRVPFGTMSSGQQELLPLWFAIEYMQETGPNAMIYIEEPEAHLFPSAQSLLVEHIASVVANESSKCMMLITTHSPYVLTQLNILLKAGMLAAANPDKHSQIDRIVKRKSWIRPEMLAAYAIVGKRVMSIHDSDGLIDADYLDDVSSHLTNTWFQLLEIEGEDVAS